MTQTAQAVDSVVSTSEPVPDPGRILETATGFWASKTLLAAVSLDLFTVLGKKRMSAAEIETALALHPRATRDFLDALVALRFLAREGDHDSARYHNTDETALYLDRNSPAWIGGLPAMMNERLYGYWGDLEEALRTGKPQSETKHLGEPLFAALARDETRLKGFLEAMSAIQTGNFHALAQHFDFSAYTRVVDVGGALGQCACILASHHPHLQLGSYDLPVVAPHAVAHIQKQGLADRVEVLSGDFLLEELPGADVITMGNILHDWNLETKKLLIAKAWEALPEGGAFIVIENLIDDARRENAFGLLMSLNMLIELGDAFDYTGADFRQWCSEAGFRRFAQFPLTGPTSAAVAWK